MSNLSVVPYSFSQVKNNIRVLINYNQKITSNKKTDVNPELRVTKDGFFYIKGEISYFEIFIRFVSRIFNCSKKTFEKKSNREEMILNVFEKTIKELDGYKNQEAVLKVLNPHPWKFWAKTKKAVIYQNRKFYVKERSAVAYQAQKIHEIKSRGLFGIDYVEELKSAQKGLKFILVKNSYKNIKNLTNEKISDLDKLRNLPDEIKNELKTKLKLSNHRGETVYIFSQKKKQTNLFINAITT